VIQHGPTHLIDGFQNQLGGMDSSKSPDLISEASYALGVNVSCRGGKPKTRPPFVQIDLNPSSTDAAEALAGLPFQGGTTYYVPAEAKTYLIAVYGGRVLKIDPVSGRVDDLSGSDLNLPYLQHYFCQAEDFLVIQNGEEIPLIYDGTTLRRSRTDTNLSPAALASLTQTAGTATATTSAPHGYSTGDYINIEGATPDNYNGDFKITVTGPTTFTYTCDSTLASPATVTSAEASYTKEVPRGTIMTYGQGRLFVASPDRTEFFAGDIIYGDIEGTKANVLRFTETEYLAEGGSFSLPAYMGRITAATVVPFQDSATGQGELLVSCEYGVGSFLVSTPRQSWKAQQIQRVLFSQEGITSPTGFASMNNDLFFRSNVGIRTYRQARAELDSYGQTPVSAEVSRILDQDDPDKLDAVSMVNFDNKILTLCAPRVIDRPIPLTSVVRSGATVTVTFSQPHYMVLGDTFRLEGADHFDGTYTAESIVSPTEATFTTSDFTLTPVFGGNGVTPKLSKDKYFQGIISQDFRSLSGAGGKSSAVYDGVWTGLRFRQIVVGYFDGAPRCFVFSTSSGGVDMVWEVYSSAAKEPSDAEVRSCVLETRALSFQKPVNKKRLLRGDLWLSEIIGKVDFQVSFKPDQSPCWVPWHTFTVCQEVDNPLLSETDDTTAIQKLPGYRTQIVLPAPPDDCDPINKKLLRDGYEFQVRLEWRGRCKVEKLLVHALEQIESVGGGC